MDEEEKIKHRNDFQRRYDQYIQEFVDAGFTIKQAEKLAEEFAQFKAI